MRVLIVVVAVLAATAANPRVRRQTDGCFWWLPDCNDGSGNGGGQGSTSTATTTATGSTSRGNTLSSTNTADATRIVNVPGTTNNIVEGKSFPSCNNNQGYCVPYYLCEDGDIITDGAGLIDIRFGPGVSSASNSGASTSHSECSNFLDVCCNAPQTVRPTDPIIDYQPQCGRRNPQGVNARILGFKDNQAQFGEFPWMAAVLRREVVSNDNDIKLYVCGGSLIHPSVVLTAAHCVIQYSQTPNSLTVRLGEWDTQRTYELYPHQDRNINRLVIHPNYASGSLYNDFALLFLERPVDLEPNVDTVCLPPPNADFTYQECWATGWGKDEFGKEGKFQNVLKKIKLDVQDHHLCQQALRTTRLGSFFKLHNSFTCAGGEAGQDTCKGDGGSPLVCENNALSGAYVQAGIVAWGIGCGTFGIPGVYAAVSYGSTWIKDTTDSVLIQMGRYTPNYWGF